VSIVSDRWPRVAAICGAALEQPPAARDQFVAEACGDDDGLRREVDALLAHAQTADRFLDAPVAAVAAHVFAEGHRLLSGRRFASYAIGDCVGAGGMGEVYRARDTRLARDVALKLLFPSLTADRARRARFELEARVLAALNHPNIGAIYGIEDLDGAPALVLEWVGGETLAARLARGPIPCVDALRIAAQIALALEAAHEKGIVHRDLKPGNIKILPDGTVKVLDFGLAKAVGDAELDLSPTLAPTSGTASGLLAGTAAYMSPEQARAQPVDKRTDIWAFGCVLYEMLTARLAFDGESASDRLAAVFDRSPDWKRLPATVPEIVRRLLRRCLDKDPKRRVHDIADARIEIEDALNGPSSLAPAPKSLLRSTASRIRWAIATTILLAGALTGARVFAPATLRPASLTRFVVQAPLPASMVTGAFDVSPDGSAIVYVGVDRTGGRNATRLFLRRLDQFDATPLAGTGGADSPFFSPDSEWVGFVAGDKLHKINVRTIAAPIVLCSVGDAAGGFTWPTDAAIFFANEGQGLQRVSAEGGQPTMVTTVREPEVDHHTARLLPDGETLLLAIREGSGGPFHPGVREPVMMQFSPATQQFTIAVQSLATGRRKVLISQGFDPHYVASGHIVYASGDAVLAVPFDAGRLEVTGHSVTLVEHVATVPQNGYGGFRLSTNGTFVFEPAPSTSSRTLTWVGRSGAETPIPISPRSFTTPRLSPDGKQVAFAVAEGDRQDIWIYAFATDTLTRATRDGINLAPMWTRDGQRLTYASNRGGTQHVMWQPADGSGAAESLLTGRNMLWPNSWTPDDRALLYVDAPPNDDHRIFVLHLDGEGPPRAEQYAERREWAPNLSPDGQWLAFTSGETGRAEISVEDFPGAREHHQISVEGGREAIWSHDGRELFYRNGPRVFAVPVDTRHGFSAGKPVMLFQGPFVRNVLDYDVAPDGRLLMIRPGVEELAPPDLHVVLNWVDELKRRVPSPK